ncbi:type II toxin-antitoxin system RelB/DinJ family antitoxin [Mitsuokella multacida]|nr:type II toxin-antitoxin system RelB/DinJ family antitoxin [Mitsuokella multacida]
MSTALLQVRVDEELKHRVDKKLKRMGLTTSSAVNLLLHRLTSRGKFLSRL